MNVVVGDRIIELARSASKSVKLVAPFIKRESLARVLRHVDIDVPVTCVTRWRPEEVAAGLSDPDIWPCLKKRGGGRLLLRNDLHAKAYLFDERCLVGSANLTDAGMGWSDSANLEVLIEVPRSTGEISALEAALEEQAVEADDQLFEEVMDAAAALAAAWRGRRPTLDGDIGFGSPAAWLPHLRTPESLFDAYCGRTSALTAATRETAEEDLRALRIPSGLERSAFERTVAIKLLQIPIIAGVDRLLAEPRRFGEVRQHLARHGDAERDWESAWQTLMRWLRYFMPHRYVLSVPHISEILIRKDALDRMLGTSAKVA